MTIGDGNVSGWTAMTNGNYLRAVQVPYTDLMGTYFYAAWILVAMGAIYMKTEDFGTTMVTGLLLSGTFYSFIPAAGQRFLYLTIILGITTVLYGLYKS